MAKISTYPILSTPTVNDLLIGTDVENLNETKNFSIGDIGTLIGQDYVPYVGATGNVNLGSFNITGGGFIVGGGTASQFLKADGSLDSTLYTPQTRTLTINGTTYNLSANRSWDLNTIDSLTTTGTSGAATYVGKVLNIPVYQAQGSYITQLSGEATGSGPGNATVTLDNTAVISKILTGLNVTGGTVVSTDTILQAFGKIQNQINGLAGGVEYQGVWNAATNTPTLQSSVGTQGYYYVVDVAGNTNLNGITDWQVGDWAIYNGSVWQKVDNTDAVVSVNGYVGAVVLTASDVGAVPTTRTLTINGVGYNLSADRAWTVGDVRTDGSYANPSWITSLGWSKITGTPTTLAGYGITDGALNTTTLTINGVTYDLTANRSWSVGTVTSVGTSGPLTGGTITGSGTIGITQSSSTTDGYLSSADWNAFNSKQGAISVNAPLTFVSGVIGITQSGASTDGYLSSTDWNTFNSKVSGSGTANTLPMWGSASSLINSPLSYAADAFNFQYNSSTGGTVNFTNIGLTAYTYSIQMNNFGSPRSTIHSYTDGLIIQSIGGTQVSRMFANGNLILGTGTVDNGYKLEVTGNLYVNTIANAATDTDRFIVSDGGLIKYRTGAQVLSDIGAQGALTLTTTGSSGPATLIGDTLNIPNYSSSLTGYVPYTGATQNVNLGEYGLTTGFLGFDLTPTGTPTTVGTMYWDPVYRTASLITGTGATTIQVGQEEVVLVHNNTGSALTDGQVVYVTGSTGNLPSVSLADASLESTSAATLGVVTETIANGADGFVTLSGIVNGLNTLAYNEGDLLWLSETAGQFTNIKPVSPAHLVLIGYVIKRAGGNGSIFVKIQNTQELAESSDVLISSPEVDGQGLFLQTVSGVQLWRNRSIADVLGYTPANAATTLTINGTTFDLSSNRTWSVGTVTSVAALTLGTSGTDLSSTVSNGTTTPVITLNVPTASATNRGALSAADWSTFNAKQNALTLTTTGTSGAATLVGSTLNIPQYQAAGTYVTAVTASSPLASSGGTTPNITIQQASGSQNGFLSSTDWTTFNNKQNALTNPVTGTGTTNYLAKFTGSTTIGNSQVFDNGTNVLIGTTTDAGFKLDVNGTGRFGGIITTTSSGIASGNFGNNAASWEGNSGYPTLFSSSADRWIMHINPHISYTQNGVNGFAGSMTGATLRYASNPAAASYWDIGVGTNSVGADKMSLGRAGVNFLAITNAGNIGIGTATPAMSLQIGNGSLTGNQYLRLFNSASDIYLGQTGSNLFSAGNGQVLVSDATYTSNFAIGTLNGSANLIFGTSNIERMRITSGGNVGIGTTSPNSIFGYNILTINNSTFGGLIDFANNNTLQGRIGADQGGVYLQAKTNIPMSFSTNDTERMRITSGGAILINRTTNVSDTVYKFIVKNSTDVNIGFGIVGGEATIEAFNDAINAATPLRIYASKLSMGLNGNVLIGTSTDNGAKFQVNGGNVTITNSGNVFSTIKTTTNTGVASYLTQNDINTTTEIGAWGSTRSGFGAIQPNNGYIFSGDELAIGASLGLKFGVGGSNTERMRITSGGNVGIGTSSPDDYGAGFKMLSINGSTAGILNLRSNNIGIINIVGTSTSADFETFANKSISFKTGNPTIETRLFITVGGNVLIGTTTDAGYTLNVAGNAQIVRSGTSTALVAGLSGVTGSIIRFSYNGGFVGSISTDGSNTAYNTSSDYRLKQDIKDFNGLDLLSKIKPYDFEWKSDKTRSYGVLAHELQEVINYAVTGSKDAEEMQGVDYSKLVPILIKAIQEQQQQIQELKNA